VRDDVLSENKVIPFPARAAAGSAPPTGSSKGWGGWILDGTTLIDDARSLFPHKIDLSGMTTSADVLFAIMLLTEFDGVTDECIGGLVRALREHLDPMVRMGLCDEAEFMRAVLRGDYLPGGDDPPETA
jgi:hypothetical protein